jgi:hypothetical protein
MLDNMFKILFKVLEHTNEKVISPFFISAWHFIHITG